VALCSAYALGGVTKLLNFSGAVAEQEQFGIKPGWLWAPMAIAVELGGSALVISGYWVWLGAGALGVLTALTSLSADQFWRMKGPERLATANTFFEHVGLVPGFVIVAMLAAHQGG
jgi:uncharacterized membrane protein YphA (DoxX/SURF4 family)